MHSLLSKRQQWVATKCYKTIKTKDKIRSVCDKKRPRSSGGARRPQWPSITTKAFYMNMDRNMS